MRARAGVLSGGAAIGGRPGALDSVPRVSAGERVAAGDVSDVPILPDYTGANVRGIIPALLGPGDWATSLPSWFPEPVRHARQAVLLVLDGLGWEQLQDHRGQAPVLSSLPGNVLTTVAPTTTATALSSIATGLTPGEHGLIGYRMYVNGEVINVLRWVAAGGDRRRASPPREVQPFAAFMGADVPVISPAELEHTAFTEAHLRGSRPAGYRASSAIAVEVGRQLRGGERFVYAYYGGVDKTAHERGFGEFYDAELRAADRIVGDILDVLRARRHAARHCRPRPGAGRSPDHRPRPGVAGDGRAAVRGGPLPLVARGAGCRRVTSPGPRPTATATWRGWCRASRHSTRDGSGRRCRRPSSPVSATSRSSHGTR